MYESFWFKNSHKNTRLGVSKSAGFNYSLFGTRLTPIASENGIAVNLAAPKTEQNKKEQKAGF
ncbi:hypothetical protein [Desulfobacter latus]|uniref:Uncharacterized protein n=1 Tax=Desulfobacter latus TaxID=2292 RepID=A0A850T716_9BACT|nr:hypothetical protein [Desulfobacter latus]NWH06891.1 hypothetical protein [Desulfobacter latus]